MQLICLLATAATFDVWERQHEWWRGREQTKWTGNANKVHGLSRLSRPGCGGTEGTKLVSDAADPCQLPDDGPSGVGGDRCLLLQLHSGDWTALWCLLLQRSTVRHRIMFHCINWRLSPLCPGRRRRPWLFALCFRLSYEYFHIRISGPKIDIRISGFPYID